MDLPILLNRAAAEPLHQQLYEELRRSILVGRLNPGQRLPSTRALAASLGLARATVVQSFGQLLSEGYLEARLGSGTFVSNSLPDELSRSMPATGGERATQIAVSLSSYGENLRAATPLEPHVPASSINFRDGRPAFDQFPIATWRRLLARHAEASVAMLDYSADPAGHRPLRESIARYLGRARAVRCTAENVIIVAGSQQALDLASRMLLDHGDAAAVEDPGYLGARQNFVAAGARLIPIPVDERGMAVERLFDHVTSQVKLVYVTPSHQFPTGTVLPLQRRLELLRWAHRVRAIVLEDDYDSAYRYGERPMPALAGLDDADCVIYVGTFSKTLFPALRIGYMVVPKTLVELFVRAKAYTDRQSPLLEQYALTDFIEEGHFERHLRRTRALYAQRREALLANLSEVFGARVTVVGERAGMQVLARFATDLPNDELVRRAAATGVFLTNAQPLYLDGGGQGEFVLGFAELDEARIRAGVERLGRAFGIA